MSGNIIWIASYPKSGNTWLRIFFSCLLEDTVSGEKINQISNSWAASSRTAFEHCTGLDSANLSPPEIAMLFSPMCEFISANAKMPIRIKIHDAYQILPNGSPLFAPAATKTAIYLVRNPLDIVVSYAHHSGKNIDYMVNILNDPELMLSYKKENATPQLPQFLGSWSYHVKSWTEVPNIPVCLLRYEDMHLQPLETFTKAIKAIGIEKSPEEILRAIKACSFEMLKKQEQDSGFRERPHTSKLFFRSGKIGSWRDSLTETQAGLIIENHSETMRRYGYLDSRGNPTF